MTGKILLLTKIQLCNLGGFNEMRFGKDKKKRGRFIVLTAAWSIVLLMLIAYMGLMSAGFLAMGMADVIPVYLFAIASVVILVFSFFKASGIIFQMKTYELLVSLPVSRAAIVVSRFLTMYITDLVLSFLTLVPGMIVYGVGIRPGIGFYIFYLLGIILLPLLPLTLATAVGAAITAVTARMRHKSIVSSVLVMILTVAFIVFELSIGGGSIEITQEMIQNLSGVMFAQIQRIYPPAIWFGNAAVSGDITDFLLLAGVSIVIFFLLMAALQKNFMRICSVLNATSARNNYRMGTLQTNSVLKALWKKELKQYFASSVYVSNTLVGYILMLIIPVVLLVMGPEKLESYMGISFSVTKFLPLILGFTAVVMPVTASSISIEGKSWWQMKALPVKTKTVLDGKLLLNLSLAAPFYLAAVILGCLAVKPSFTEALLIVAVPAVYIVFSAVVGMTLNLAFPIFDWENEAQAVKQGAASGFSMLAGMVSAAVPLVCLIFAGDHDGIVYLVTIVALIICSIFLYRHNASADFMEIG